MHMLCFNHNLRQIEVKSDKLYICDDVNIYVYNSDNFQFLEKFVTKSERKYYRIAGFFFTK